MEVPTRTCLACRQPAAKPSLIRLAAVDGRVRVDPLAIQQTRGAYVCATPECTAKAVRRDGAAIARALRTTREAVDVGLLRAALEDERARREGDDKVAAEPSRGACT